MIPMNNPMMGNPLMALVQAAKGGGNPMMLLQQMAGQNPQAAQAMRMVQGKTPQQLRSMAENMCKERGVTPEQVAQQLGIPMR